MVFVGDIVDFLTYTGHLSGCQLIKYSFIHHHEELGITDPLAVIGEIAEHIRGADTAIHLTCKEGSQNELKPPPLAAILSFS